MHTKVLIAWIQCVRVSNKAVVNCISFGMMVMTMKGDDSDDESHSIISY